MGLGELTALCAPPDPLDGGEGLAAPSPRTPPPLSVLRASGFVPLHVREKTSPPQNKFGLTPMLIRLSIGRKRLDLLIKG